MPELHEIAAEIRRQRKDIDEFLERTSSRGGEAAQLVNKIEQLRQRTEKTRSTSDTTQSTDRANPPR